MDGRILRTFAVLGVVGSLGLSGCSRFGGDPEPSASSGVTTTDSPSATASPAPTKSTQPSAAVGPTIAELEQHLDGIIRSVQGSGKLTCEGDGGIGTGTAVTCDWDSSVSSWPSGPVHVAVLDDSGRYAFQMSDVGPNAGAAPSDYPAGTIDCRTLMAPPVGSDKSFGLAYPSLVNYWMAAGSPESMDDDRNGIPCETVYPADVVARTVASPLVPGNDASPENTLEDVRQHAEAAIGGIYGPGSLPLISDDVDMMRGKMNLPAETGWRFPMDWVYDEPAQGFGVQFTVLSDSGRYAISFAPCCGAGPTVSDYPVGAKCKQLLRPPKGADQWDSGLDYGSTVFFWMLHGRPSAMDGDGNGKPCEDVYPASEVSKYFGSTLEP